MDEAIKILKTAKKASKYFVEYAKSNGVVVTSSDAGGLSREYVLRIPSVL